MRVVCKLDKILLTQALRQKNLPDGSGAALREGISGMTPFDKVFSELARREVGVIYAHEDPRLPDGTYVFREFFCGAPTCECNSIGLRVEWLESSECLAHLVYKVERRSFRQKAMRRVFLDPAQPQGPLADTLRVLFERMLDWDPEYATQLASHHALWRHVAEEPLHPMHERLREAVREGSAGSSARPCCGVQ